VAKLDDGPGQSLGVGRARARRAPGTASFKGNRPASDVLTRDLQVDAQYDGVDSVDALSGECASACSGGCARRGAR